MKFELNPYNYGLSDEQLLSDLRSVADRLRKDYVTKEEYDKLGRLCSTTFQKRFGSWCKANELAGLKRIRNYHTTVDDCLADLKRVAASLGTDCITTLDYKKHGRFSLSLISRRIGSWEEAMGKAGLKRSPLYHKPITDEKLFENLEKIWEKLGRQPTRNDLERPLSRCSYSVYSRRFGTWRKALEAFVASFDRQADELKQDSQEAFHREPAPVSVSSHKTSRSISWRMRFLVMRRDDFKCQLCGVAPAIKPGTVLVVDHILAWAAGGETVMENLQTLCEQCNGIIIIANRERSSGI